VQKQEPRSLVEERFSVCDHRERESLKICDVGCAAKDNFSNWDWAREYLCNSWNVGGGDKADDPRALDFVTTLAHQSSLVVAYKSFLF
jgi:hypothetical protein